MARETGYLDGPMAVWADRMLSELESLQRKHKGEQGRVREDTVRAFLEQHLPKRLGVATGEIAASDGSISPQVDIIVYDRMVTPLLSHSESSVVVPVEGVYVVIEVSSFLNGSKLAEDAAKIRAIKQMPKVARFAGGQTHVYVSRLYGRRTKHFTPLVGACFAYDSISLDGLIYRVAELDGEDVALNLDMACSVTQGCVLNLIEGDHPDDPPGKKRWSGTPQPGSHRIGVPLDPARPSGSALMLFYLMLNQVAASGQTETIHMGHYIG